MAPLKGELSAPFMAVTEGLTLPSSGLREMPDATSPCRGGMNESEESIC